MHYQAIWCSEVLNLMKELTSRNDKQVAIYNGPKDRSDFLRHLSRDNYFLIDLRLCSYSTFLLDRINNSRLFRHPLKYLLLLDVNGYEQILETMKNYTVYPSNHVVLAIINDSFVGLEQIYRVGEGRELLVENYGNWSRETGLQENFKYRFEGVRRKNLRGMHLRIATLMNDNDTINHLMTGKYPRIDNFAKQDFPVFDNLMDYVNATYDIIGCSDHGYYNNETKSFSGVVGELLHERSHIAGLAIYMTQERMHAADYMTFQNPVEIKFIVKKPSTSYIKDIFIITFRWNVWTAMFVIMIIFMAAMWYILNCEWKFDVKGRLADKQKKYSLLDMALIVLEALCQQGTVTETYSLSGRTAFFFLFVCFMAIYVAYSAYIVVLLQSTTKINNLQELLESRVAVGGENTNYAQKYFEEPRSGVLRDIYLKKIYPDKYYTYAEGMKKVQEGNFAFHGLMGPIYDYVQKHFSSYDVCGLQELPGYMEFLRGYSAVPKNSPYKEIFKIGLMKINEHGLRTRQIQRVHVKPKCYMSTASFQNVGVYDCYEVFLIWSGGAFLAVLVFFIEYVVLIVKRRKHMNTYDSVCF